MVIQTLPVGKLVPADYNPRKDLKPGDPEYEKLKHSLTEFGYVEPVIWNKTTSHVVGGHQRLKVLVDTGVTEIECVVVEMGEEKEKALNVALNKISGEWDKDKLSLLIADLQLADFDVSLTGFDAVEIDKLLSSGLDASEDGFNVDAELEKPAFSKLGDVWTLGRHRVICGDSTKPETYTALMNGRQANLILTDPPYGIDYDKGAAGKIKNDKFDSDEGFYKFLHNAFSAMVGYLADDGAAYVFHADSKGLTFRRAFEDAGFKLSGCCIWAKNTFTLGRSDYQWCHEPCLYGWKKSGKHIWYGDRKQSTIWNFDKPSRSEKHPTMKPVPLIAVPMKNSTQTNGLVLDPFGGSGSTLICAEQLGREAYLIELDEKFVDVIVNRYIEAVGSADGVFVERDGVQTPYSEVAHA
ncbi:MAG: site-specific DNA-methyltransferase [Christensenella sp.]|nr:site-specific DNA-methyltransferase [Christensenella sp.]